MAGEPVYTFLSHPSGSNAAMAPHLSIDFNSRQDSHWTRIALWIAWAGNAILLVIVMFLVFQVGQLRATWEKHCTSQGGNNGINESSLENKTSTDNMYHVRQYLCMLLENTTETSSCKVCPPSWYLHKKKCYWISTEKLTWNKSLEDCTAKLSQMVVIQNQEEMDFIQNITKANKILWIGLQATSPKRKWTWVDGSPCDGKLSDPAEANTCGKLNRDQIISDACINPASWICEKAALFL